MNGAPGMPALYNIAKYNKHPYRPTPFTDQITMSSKILAGLLLRSKTFRALALLSFTLACAAVSAEGFQNITAGQTLGSIKAQFPAATIESVEAAWVTESDGFYRLSGPGFPGKLYLVFSDMRPFQRKMLEKISEKIEASPEGTITRKDVFTFEYWTKLANETTDNSLKISNMRWVPDASIPLQRYIAKYGKPDASGFSDADMKPYAEWKKRGIYLNLSDDQKQVQSVEFSFTKEEERVECRKKYQKADWAKECA
ncbi:hypothetical protein ABIE30_002932 [Janthinobacterium lividum]|uniref:hypothetical protein n=1 Tax=Janthinobacterium lividum TaxID=29581 RepID=UPI003D1E6F3E